MCSRKRHEFWVAVILRRFFRAFFNPGRMARESEKLCRANGLYAPHCPTQLRHGSSVTTSELPRPQSAEAGVMVPDELREADGREPGAVTDSNRQSIRVAVPVRAVYLNEGIGIEGGRAALNHASPRLIIRQPGKPHLPAEDFRWIAAAWTWMRACSRQRSRNQVRPRRLRPPRSLMASTAWPAASSVIVGRSCRGAYR